MRNNIIERLDNIQLFKLSQKWYAALERLFAGGLRYGVDWPTLNMVEPGRAAVGRRIYAEVRRRKLSFN